MAQGHIRRGFEALDNIERFLVLGCELWTENFNSMFALVKEYIHNQLVGG